MRDGRVKHLNAGVDAAERFPLPAKNRGEGAVFPGLPGGASGPGAVRSPGQPERERGKFAVVVVPQYRKFRIERIRRIREARPHGETDRVAAAVELVIPVRNHAVLFRFAVFFVVDVAQLDVVKVEAVERSAALHRGGHHPDVVVVGVGFHRKAAGESLPFGGRAEGERLQHRVIGVAVVVGEKAEVDGERAQLVQCAAFIRTDLGVEGDLHFAVAGEQNVGKFQLVVGNAPIAGDHQALAGISPGNGARRVEPVRVRPDRVDRGAVDVEKISRNTAPGFAQFHVRIEVDRLSAAGEKSQRGAEGNGQ